MYRYTDDNYLDILRHNKKFENPALWVKYAKKHNFQKVDAINFSGCPDCNNSKSIKIGQYVYYSNLICLRYCCNCGLIYSDTLLDSKILKKHFESAYKDEEYFSQKRRQIFIQIAKLVNQFAPIKGKVIDIGGAKGHQLQIIKNIRPDLFLLLNEISKISCEYAKNNFDISSINCNLHELQFENEGYDIVILSDVLYYEGNINKVWEIFSQLKRGSTIIMRIPNKLPLIKLTMTLIKLKLFIKKESHELIDHIKFFNPEHLYIFSNKYLKKRLKKTGFNKINILPSACLVQNDRWSILYAIYFKLSKMIYLISGKHIILTPSKIICAKKND